jgi:hypothetical protein
VAARGHAGAIAVPPPRTRRPRPSTAEPTRAAKAAKPRRARAAQHRQGLFGGVVWIAALTLLLGGLVAVNVYVLQLNVRIDHLGQERTDLRAGNAALSAQLSSAGAPPHVVAVAHRRLGLVPAAPEQTTYVQLAPEK